MDIVISPIHKTFFTGRIWDGLGIDRIAAVLSDAYGHRVAIIDFSDVAADYGLIPPGACWFYTPSYDERYNRYIRDVVTDFTRSRKDAVLIPDLDQLFSFENKGYQELYKKRLGIGFAKGRYFGDRDEFAPDETFTYPFVLKKINGSVSSGVRLVRSRKEFHALLKKENRQTLIEKLRFHKRRFKQTIAGSENRLSFANFMRFSAKRTPFVVQEFIPGLNHDYKVLVFGEKYYVLKRWTRPHDFRASGSGRFEKAPPPPEVLDYAETITQKLGAPFCSLDIAYTDAYCALLEFQGIGFGPVTLTGSSFYFTRVGGAWERVDRTSNLEEEYARAIHGFLARLQEGAPANK